MTNYEAISDENRRRYGTDIGRIGPMLLADRYDDRTHFIFELLQNAEDALGRRTSSTGSRAVEFELTPTQLSLSHFGRPFDELDVRGVCGIAESTKDGYSIGRFGIGFKSVYTFTDRPEIHSGDEDFAIENYVQPRQATRIPRMPGQTRIVLPLKAVDTAALQEITEGLRRLGPSALLFLRHIEEINWSVEDGASGFYLRNSPETFGKDVRRVTVVGQESGRTEVDQNWLVFQREVFSDRGERVGRVEIAFSLLASEDSPGIWSVQPVSTSPLVVFFPTVVPTNLGFLVQGPYRTTPSRDNVPRSDPWNQHLVIETATLLIEALRWMRDSAMLDTQTLRCLPIDTGSFGDAAMFSPFFDVVRQAILDEPLLPSFDGGFVAASQAKLARTQELRELFSPKQIEVLFGTKTSAWLTGDITADREPDIRTYLMEELDVLEVTPANLVPRLSADFLEAQSDEWTLRLYEFLGGQGAALRRHLDTIPLIRLADGSHVVARSEDGVAGAFLPSSIKTDFPTIRRSVCATEDARGFLISLGITEPDPVDDVIWNLLPRYQQDQVDVSDEDYAADIERIREAFSTDSNSQREKLVGELRKTSFVMAVDSGDGHEYVQKPDEVYIATDRLQQLFAGVPGVMIVDNRYDCLRGEDIRDMLVSCGASRYLVPQKVPRVLGSVERVQLRREAGLENASWQNAPEDFDIRGLAGLLSQLQRLSFGEAAKRSKVLWEALIDLEGRGTASFFGTYRWGYYNNERIARFSASFVELLNRTAWVPGDSSQLMLPRLVEFESLGWKSNPFLLTRVPFKPPIINQLAREAGIDPAAIDLLRRLNISSVTELQSRLGIVDPPAHEQAIANDSKADGLSTIENSASTETTESDVYVEAKDLYGEDMPTIPEGSLDSDDGDETGSGGASWSGSDTRANGRDRTRGTGAVGDPIDRKPAHKGERPFISYVGSHPEDEDRDPDGLDQSARMEIEERAIGLIVSFEPKLKRAPEGNPGFDLFEANSIGQPVRWVEVKSMTGSLDDRPVGVSRKQFEHASEKGDAYWLYIVEHATDQARARVLRIQNPIARARTFTFDSGWINAAQMEPPN